MDQRVRAIMDLIERNLHETVSVRQFADHVRLSPSRFRELFKKETGTSVLKYRRQLQLRRAKQLLESTFLSVKEVAGRVGITDVSHFVRDFTKAYRVTPGRYPHRHFKAASKPSLQRKWRSG
jgi:transcriptional regulator GlxA family with amidase domain